MILNYLSFNIQVKNVHYSKFTNTHNNFLCNTFLFIILSK